MKIIVFIKSFDETAQMQVKACDTFVVLGGKYCFQQIIHNKIFHLYKMCFMNTDIWLDSILLAFFTLL